MCVLSETTWFGTCNHYELVYFLSSGNILRRTIAYTVSVHSNPDSCWIQLSYYLEQFPRLYWYPHN
jgi:hypothetical protein